MSKYAIHQNFLKEQLYLTQREFKNIRFFERHVGLFYTIEQNPVKINMKGMADVWALIKVNEHTYHLEIEFKTGTAVLSKSQKKWKQFCLNIGVDFFLVTPKHNLPSQIGVFVQGKNDNKKGRTTF